MQPCGAARPPLPGRDKGWDCEGTNLVVLLLKGEPITASGVPMVIRADLYDRLAEEDYIDGRAPFPGGDHVHAMLKPEGADG